jgi:ABC-type branched-subunit amino acid transport system ATPase component
VNEAVNQAVSGDREVDETVHHVSVETPPLGTPATAPESEKMLSCRGIDMYYGSVQILFGVDFDVEKDELVALLGTNGAGKSTLLKGICGLVRPKKGTVTFKGEDITKLHADVTARRGISMMPGGKGVFPTLSVAENLKMSAWLIRDHSSRVEAAREEVLALFPICPSAITRWPATSPAVSSRCWPWARPS